MRSLAALLLVLLCAPAAWTAPDLFETEAVVFEKVATGYRFTEGPAADAQGNVYFTDIPNQRIHRLDVATGKVRVVRVGSGRANGLVFDALGRLVACEGGGRRLVRIDGDKLDVLATHYGGKRLNSPNDLTLDATGGIWFTDPRYGKQDDRELDVMAVYYRAATGAVTQVIKDLPRPNGILLSRDGTMLYVAANKRQLIMAYDVAKPGIASKARVFAHLDHKARGGPDGMTLDEQGNVYAAGQGHVWIWSSKGKLLHKLKVPEGPSNCAFGGPKHDTLYVTARTSLYRVRMRVKGAGAVRPTRVAVPKPTAPKKASPKKASPPKAPPKKGAPKNGDEGQAGST